MLHVGMVMAFSAILGLGVSGDTNESSPIDTPNDLVLLAGWMTGSFSSSAQAMEDSSYFDVRLQMVRIWPQRNDGFWLYVEQAIASALDRPYRQRVYHIHHIGGPYYGSDVYELPDPARYAGAWKGESPLVGLGPDDLLVREGCTIVLKRQDESYVGSTLDRLCESSLRGASYATSDVTIRRERLISWDRGFDGDGEQVWGATKGGYVFEKVEDYPLE